MYGCGGDTARERDRRQCELQSCGSQENAPKQTTPKKLRSCTQRPGRWRESFRQMKVAGVSSWCHDVLCELCCSNMPILRACVQNMTANACLLVVQLRQQALAIVSARTLNSICLVRLGENKALLVPCIANAARPAAHSKCRRDRLCLLDFNINDQLSLLVVAQVGAVLQLESKASGYSRTLLHRVRGGDCPSSVDHKRAVVPSDSHMIPEAQRHNKQGRLAMLACRILNRFA